MAINALPALDRTSATFKADLDTYFLTALPGFTVQAEAARVEMVGNAASASTSAGTATAQANLAAQSASSAMSAANYKGLWSALTGALATPATVYHAGTYWVLNSNLANVATATPGVSASWTESGPSRLPYSGRTSNTMLAGGDRAALIDITSGTFAQTFPAAATLGNGWLCYIRNNGTGDITLTPNGAELIDGLSSYVMYPGETRLVCCTGTGFVTVVLTTFKRTFTASGTFTKPPGYNRFAGLIWGGGGGGTNAGYGGNGGNCIPIDVDASAIGTTQTVTIGAGGATGAAGGASVFSIYTTGVAAPGLAGSPGLNTLAFGRIITNSTDVMRLTPANSSSSRMADYGGGVGVNTSLTDFGSSVYGGAGGNNSSAGCLSVFGGRGGGSVQVSTAPGGGGGTNTAGGTTVGSRGELRLWGIL